MASVQLVGVGKTYAREGEGRSEPFTLHPTDLTIADGHTLVILGPSGCGKSTLLRIVAGLLKPDRGRVLYDGDDVTRDSPRSRRLGMVFQDFALYPHLDNRTNILSYFYFRGRRPGIEAEAEEKLRHTSRLMDVDLSYLLHRTPAGLSPGEKQRVALARSITRDPALLLLDEPFAHLDQRLRERYRLNLKRLLNDFRVTTIYVTHDQQEALLLADRIAVMNEGQVVQQGTFQELYRAPLSAFVADFLNPDPLTPSLNFVDGGLVSGRFAGMRVGVRPEDAAVALEREGIGVEASVVDSRPLPSKTGALVQALAGDSIFYVYATEPDVRWANRVWLRFDRFHLFDGATGECLETHPF
jgi:ABC-type sugar transport system ATPase subunit